jgi:hypothetical protein
VLVEQLVEITAMINEKDLLTALSLDCLICLVSSRNIRIPAYVAGQTVQNIMMLLRRNVPTGATSRATSAMIHGTASLSNLSSPRASNHHLGTTVDSKAIKIRIAPHHFARAALKQFPQLQTSVTKSQIKSVDLAEYGKDGERPHAENVNLITSLFRKNKQTMLLKDCNKHKDKYVIAPLVAKTTVEAKYKQLHSNTTRQHISRVTRCIGGKAVAPDPAGYETPSHEDNFKTPGRPRVSTDEHEEVRVVTEAKTPTDHRKDTPLSVGSVACLPECSNLRPCSSAE